MGNHVLEDYKNNAQYAEQLDIKACVLFWESTKIIFCAKFPILRAL
jgi:hypothetical protein